MTFPLATSISVIGSAAGFRLYATGGPACPGGIEEFLSSGGSSAPTWSFSQCLTPAQGTLQPGYNISASAILDGNNNLLQIKIFYTSGLSRTEEQISSFTYTAAPTNEWTNEASQCSHSCLYALFKPQLAELHVDRCSGASTPGIGAYRVYWPASGHERGLTCNPVLLWRLYTRKWEPGQDQCVRAMQRWRLLDHFLQQAADVIQLGGTC